jgi:hypothetical protein
MRVRLGCLIVHEHTSHFASGHITDDTDDDGDVGAKLLALRLVVLLLNQSCISSWLSAP